MKQGSGITTQSARKVEPTVTSYTPGAAAQIGMALGNHVTDCGQILHGSSAPMYENKRGHLPPENPSFDTHPRGSQGKR